MSDAGRRVGLIGKRLVDASGKEAKLYRVWDSKLKGFGLRVTPAGVKTYFIYYRPGGGRSAPQREYTIGRHGPLTPDQARSEAERLLGTVRLGDDPQANRNKIRKDITVAELCDLYLKEGVATKKDSTLYTDKRRIEVHIKPLLGRRQQASITSTDVERFLQDVANGKTARREKLGKRALSVVTGGKGTATRTVGLLGGIYTFAVKRHLRPDNPVKGVERYKDKESQRYLSAAELGALGAALIERAGEGSNRKALDVIRLLTFTGARRGEIEALKWSEVDLQRSQLRLQDSKSGPKTVMIGAPALAVLEGITRQTDSPYVFPATRNAKKFYTGTPKVWAKVRKAADLPGVRPHDLRHTYASLAAGGGQSLIMIGALLGHRDVKTTRKYAHLADDPVQNAAERTAGHAAAAVAGERGEVVLLKRRHGGGE